MKGYKKLIVLVLIIVIMIGGNGCMGIQNDMVEYLNKKYDDKFTYKETIGGKLFGGDTVTIECTCEKYPNELVYVIYHKSSEKYYDDYLKLKYQDQIEEMYNNLLLECFGKDNYTYAKYKESSKMHDFDGNLTLDEYIAKENESLLVYVDASALNEKKEEIKSIVEKRINESKLKFFNVRIYFMDNFKKLLETDSVKVKMIKGEYKEYLFGEKEDDDEKLELKWEDK